MAFQTPSHANAHAIQCLIMTRLIGKRNARDKGDGSPVEELDPFQLCKLAESWVFLEAFKRELRGIPRIKPVELKDLLERKMKRAKAAITNAEPVEA